MNKDWFLPSKLAGRLARGGVSNREVAYLILANLLFGWVIFYGAFTWANTPWTFLSLLECVVVVAVTLIGFTKCFDAAGGEANKDFAVHFNCLSFGVWVWTTVITWSIFWFGVWLLRQGVFAAYNFEHLGLAKNLASIGANFGWLWTVLATVGGQIVYFWWLSKVLRKASHVPDPNSPLNPDASRRLA